MKDPKTIGFRRIPINDLDWRPGPLPNADAWRAGEPDLPAGAFDGSVAKKFLAAISSDPRGDVSTTSGVLRKFLQHYPIRFLKSLVEATDKAFIGE